jgi:hypothetical protein
LFNLSVKFSGNVYGSVLGARIHNDQFVIDTLKAFQAAKQIRFFIPYNHTQGDKGSGTVHLLSIEAAD